MRLHFIIFSFIFCVFLSCKKGEKVFKRAYNDPCDTNVVIVNNASIEGYSDKNSYSPGDTIYFKIHCLSDDHSIEILRFGKQETSYFNKTNVVGIQQNYHCYSYSYGCRWKSTFKVVVEDFWTSGLYSAKITNNKDGVFNWITFIVKPDKSSTGKIAVIASTNTWQAYNDWGGASFYNYYLDESIKSSENISFLRPNVNADPVSVGKASHLVSSEIYLLKWLELESYSYDVYCERDLHDSASIFDNYKVIIIQTHPEYYSTDMYMNLYRYVFKGGNLMYLGGNGIYHKVVIDKERNILEVRSSGKTHNYVKESGGLWRELGIPEAGLLGVEYEPSGYNTYHAYKVIDKGHWVFAGTKVENGTLFGYDSKAENGASGHETDKTSEKVLNLKNLKILAKGENPGLGGAEMIYYYNDSGGQVFSVGSISYTSFLLKDSVVSRITQNVLERFMK